MGLLIAATKTGMEEVTSSWSAAIGLGTLGVVTIIVARGRLGLRDGPDRDFMMSEPGHDV